MVQIFFDVPPTRQQPRPQNFEFREIQNSNFQVAEFSNQLLTYKAIITQVPTIISNQ